MNENQSHAYTVDIVNLIESLKALAEKEAFLKNQVKKLSDDISILCRSPEITKPACTTTSSKIIPFPCIQSVNMEFSHSKPNNRSVLEPIMALPENPLPADIPDCRPVLQRDGLILLAWDKRVTERGELFTAYWVTSAGVARFYASKPLCFAAFASAHPDHKSYAAEDGIEFYGQDQPAYLVHVAPELMMSNPHHGELRQTHINKLRRQGSRVNFNYKYLLKTEKSRIVDEKSNGTSRNRPSWFF